MDSLVYFVYGDGPHFDEAAYSIVSAKDALGREDKCRLVVYTDRPARFDGLPVHVETIDGRCLSDWTRPHGYKHRAKICVIRDALSRFGERVAFCDSDTYFLSSPEQLFIRVRPSATVMHLCEGRLDESNGPGLSEFLDHHVLNTVAGLRWNITGDTLMFNSGVVGIHHADIDLLDEALCMVDQIYPHVKLFNLEQFAVGACLNARTTLRPCHDVVCHYWQMPDRARFQDQLGRALRGASAASLDNNLRRLSPYRPKPSAHHYTPSMKAQVRSAFRRVARATGIIS